MHTELLRYKYLRTNTRKMIHDRFFHFILIRTVKKEKKNYPCEDSDAACDGSGSPEKTISLVRKEEFFGSRVSG